MLQYSKNSELYRIYCILCSELSYKIYDNLSNLWTSTSNCFQRRLLILITFLNTFNISQKLMYAQFYMDHVKVNK